MIYDLLLELPLFQGLSHDQLTAIVEQVAFRFERFQPGDVIVEAGAPCSEVTFVLSGEVEQQTLLAEGRLTVVQTFEAPQTITFCNLFGTQTAQPSSLKALTQVGVMRVAKEQFLKMLQLNRVILVGALNILSAHAQKQHHVLAAAVQPDATLRLASWLLLYTERSASAISIEAQPEAWCGLLNLDQATFWHGVSQLEADKWIRFEGSVLKLTDRYGLRSYVGRKMSDK